jgi:hypothetical protein
MPHFDPIRSRELTDGMSAAELFRLHQKADTVFMPASFKSAQKTSIAAGSSSTNSTVAGTRGPPWRQAII